MLELCVMAKSGQKRCATFRLVGHVVFTCWTHILVSVHGGILLAANGPRPVGPWRGCRQVVFYCKFLFLLDGISRPGIAQRLVK